MGRNLEGYALFLASAEGRQEIHASKTPNRLRNVRVLLCLSQELRHLNVEANAECNRGAVEDAFFVDIFYGLDLKQ